MHVSDCMVALKNIEENLLFYNKDTQWFEVKDKLDLLRLACSISLIIECHLFKLIKWLTGGDDDGTNNLVT